jgi:hypothetical protein
MYIMRRMGHVEGIDGIEKAVEVTQIVQNAGLPASLWVAGPGSVPGTVAWSVGVETFEQWADYTDKLAADAAYADFARKNVGTITMAQADTLSEVVHGEVQGGSEVGDYIGSLEAVVHPDRAADAGAFAVEVADAFTETTGLPVAVVRNLAGDQGTIGWLVRYGTAGAVDEAEAKTAASADYAAIMAKNVGMFTSGNRLFARRAA